MLTATTSPAWLDALARVPHDVYHLPGWAAVAQRGDGGEPVAFVWHEGDNTLLLPLMIRPLPGTDALDASSAYGYGGPAASPAMDATAWKRACAALVDELRERGAVSCFVRLHPLLAGDRAAMAEVGAVPYHGDTVTIDLTQSPERLRALVRQNHRRDIKRLCGLGYRVVVDEHWSRLGDFVQIYHQTMARVGARDYYFFDTGYFEALRDRLRGHTHLLVAEVDGEVASGGIFTEAGGLTGYHLGATRDEHLPRSPFKAVVDHARDWARARGNHDLHLGGGLGAESGALLRFKLGFSDLRQPFHTWRIVIDRARYAELCRRLRPGVDPRDEAGFFPAYRDPGVAAEG